VFSGARARGSCACHHQHHARRETPMILIVAVATGICFAGAIAAITFGLVR
jgi:hypothetical protein